MQIYRTAIVHFCRREIKNRLKLSTEKKYDANFTAGGLLYFEIMALKDVILDVENLKNRLKIEQSENHYLKIATVASRKRIIREIERRLERTTTLFWSEFYLWSEPEKKLSLLFVCLKTYPILLDLHFEVTVKKYKVGSSLRAEDIALFMEKTSANNADVDSWTESTKNKINHQYRKSLREAGLIQASKLQKPTKISNDFWQYFIDEGEAWFLDACFI